jgi:hypothetical protein
MMKGMIRTKFGGWANELIEGTWLIYDGALHAKKKKEKKRISSRAKSGGT